MPGSFSPVKGAQPVEYVEETTYATPEDDASYNWFGITTSWDAEQGVESESITYLPEYGADNKLEKNVNVKLREMYEADVSYHPQGTFDMLKYFTGSAGGTSDSVTPIQVGEINESAGEYRRLLGGVGEEFTLSVEEDGVAEIEGSFTFGEANDWTLNDYVNDSGITALSSSVSPETDSSVGVKTESVTTGEVVLYDTSDNELARVDASTSYTAADVSGTTVVSVRLVNTDTNYSSETITVDGETDGSGTSSGTADVTASGDHAAEDTTEPWSYDDLGSVTYGGTSLDGAVESVELTVSNELAVVRDANSSLSTQIAAIVPVDREITVDVEFTYNNFDILNDVRSYTPKTFEFTLGNTTFTIDGVQFPEAPYEFSADDLVSDSLSSDRASSLTWA